MPIEKGFECFTLYQKSPIGIKKKFSSLQCKIGKDSNAYSKLLLYTVTYIHERDTFFK